MQAINPDADMDGAARPAPAAKAALPWTRVYLWSVRRELWEHRSIWMAPAIAAGVILVGFFLSTFRLAEAAAKISAAEPRAADALVTLPYVFASAPVIIVSLIVGIVYSQGALHQERRDRSVLFWKSLPVSDLITVASKATLPLVVLPAAMLATIGAAHLIMLAWGSVVVGIGGGDVGSMVARTHVDFIWKIIGPGVPFIVLWWAPIFAWLMMFGAFFKRVPWLWAFGGPVAVAILERLIFDTKYVGHFLAYRVGGPFKDAIRIEGADRHNPFPAGAAVDFQGWTEPQLWIGLAAAAVFLVVAVRLRRSADPI